MSNTTGTTGTTGTITIFGKTKTKETLEEFKINLDDIMQTYAFFMEQQAQDPNFRIPTFRARIPAGGGLSFDIITGDKDFDTSISKFAGVISSSHATNALFDNKNKGMDKPPICQSPNGIIGTDLTGKKKKCETCEYNQWGSDEKGGGKQCKNMRRLYILADGCNIPLVMSVPPTSTSNWENYRSILAIDRKVPSDVVTEFSLSQEKSGGGVEYSIVHFKAVGSLGEETKEAIKQLSPKKDLTITDDDYYTGEKEAPASAAKKCGPRVCQISKESNRNLANLRTFDEVKCTEDKANSEVVGEQPKNAEEPSTPNSPNF